MRSHSSRKTKSWSLWRALAIIFVVWVVAVVVLAASEALRELAAPAAPVVPQATPHANTDAPALNCHRSGPPTNSPWLTVARADAQKYGIDGLTFLWQIWQESGYQPNALSPAGAEGIAQFMPDTAAGMGIDPWNSRQALDASARLDASHLKQYAADVQALAQHYGSIAARYAYGLALVAYNAGPGATTGAWGEAYGNGTR